jgi:hypothetical protein
MLLIIRGPGAEFYTPPTGFGMKDPVIALRPLLGHTANLHVSSSSQVQECSGIQGLLLWLTSRSASNRVTVPVPPIRSLIKVTSSISAPYVCKRIAYSGIMLPTKSSVRLSWLNNPWGPPFHIYTRPSPNFETQSSIRLSTLPVTPLILEQCATSNLSQPMALHAESGHMHNS